MSFLTIRDTRIGFDPEVLAKLFVNRSDLLLRCGDRLLAKKTRCILDASACRLRHADGHEHHSDGPYSSPASLRLIHRVLLSLCLLHNDGVRPPAVATPPACTAWRAPLGLASQLWRRCDLLQRLTRLAWRVTAHRQIPQRDHPHEPLVAGENRQPANLVALHDLYGVLDPLIVKAVGDVRGHGLPDRGGGRIAALRDRPHGDVTIREHADEPLALADGQGADIESSHLGRRLL